MSSSRNTAEEEAGGEEEEGTRELSKEEEEEERERRAEEEARARLKAELDAAERSPERYAHVRARWPHGAPNYAPILTCDSHTQ
jgi:hypothetical protein